MDLRGPRNSRPRKSGGEINYGLTKVKITYKSDASKLSKLDKVMLALYTKGYGII